MIMVMVLVLEVRITDCVPEVNRSRSLYMKAMSIHQKGDTSDNSSNGCMSLTVAKECFKALTVPEAVTIVSTGGRMRISVPAGKMMTVDNLETDDTFWKVFSFDFIAGKQMCIRERYKWLTLIMFVSIFSFFCFLGCNKDKLGKGIFFYLFPYLFLGISLLFIW